jgi:hypothetical protein
MKALDVTAHGGAGDSDDDGNGEAATVNDGNASAEQTAPGGRTWRGLQLATMTGSLIISAGLIGSYVQAPAAEPRPPRVFWVATDGRPDSQGSTDRPLDLKTALSNEGPVRQGDTVWVRGGTYRGAFTTSLDGTAAAPIMVRRVPGERVTIDSGESPRDALTAGGSHTWFWGLEITSSDTKRQTDQGGSWPTDLRRGYGSATRAPGIRYINLILHDNGGGLGIWSEAIGSDAYGNIIYNNGWEGPDRSHGHGIYTQNQHGQRHLTDNIVFNQFSHGIHAYGSGEAYLDNISIAGNILFNNGALSAGAEYERNLLLGGGRTATSPKVEANVTYFDQAKSGGQNNVGYAAGCTDFTIAGNYFIGGLPLVLTCPTGVFTGNVLQGAFSPSMRDQYPENEYRVEPPSGTRVVVRPNRCEPGRAHVAIFNWDRLPSISVDLRDAGLSSGAQFTIHNVEDYFGAPVARGTWDGASIEVPMTGLRAAPAVGMPAPESDSQPREFGAFVVVQQERPVDAAPAVPPGCVVAQPRESNRFTFTQWLNDLRGRR